MKAKLTVLIILSFLFVLHHLSAVDSAVHSKVGDYTLGQVPTIDLRDHDFAQNGLARLDGEWAMYWERLLDPQLVRGRAGRGGRVEDVLLATDSALFRMPGTWNSYVWKGEQLGSNGYASFVVRVLLPPELRRGALRFSPASTSCRVWIDGVEVAASGAPGTTAETSIPGRVTQNPVFETDAGSILLLMHVANFHHRVGGMWRPVWIGPADEIAAYDIIDISYDLLFLGMCLAFVAYNLLIYFAGSRRSATPLLFALFFLSLGLRVPTLGAVLATRAFPELPWHAVIFIEYMSGHLIIAFFCSALHLTYPRILEARFSWTVVALMAVFSLFLIFAGVTRYSLIINAFLVVAVAVLVYPTLRLSWAGAHGNKEVRFGVVAVLVVLSVVVSEWVHFSELLLSRDATPLGFLVGMLPVPPGARAETHLALTAATLVLILTAASLLLYKVSDGLFGAAARHATAEEPELRSAEDSGTARQEALRAHYDLTTREAEIAFHVAEGLSNKEIAAVLYISEGTVRTHIYRVFKKTASKSRTELGKIYFSVAQS